ARSVRVACRRLRELCDLRRLSSLRSRWGTRDLSTRYAGCDAQFRAGPGRARRKVRDALRTRQDNPGTGLMRRISVAALMLVSIAGAASAQRPQRGFTSDPDTWATASVGGFRANGVNDGATGSTWDFGNSVNLEYRASLEKGWNNGSSFGV